MGFPDVKVIRTRSFPARPGKPARGNEVFAILLIHHAKDSQIFKDNLSNIRRILNPVEARVSSKRVKRLPKSVKNSAMNIIENEGPSSASAAAEVAASPAENAHNISIDELISTVGALSFFNAGPPATHGSHAASSTEEGDQLASLFNKLGFHGGGRTRRYKKRNSTRRN